MEPQRHPLNLFFIVYLHNYMDPGEVFCGYLANPDGFAGFFMLSVSVSCLSKKQGFKIIDGECSFW